VPGAEVLGGEVPTARALDVAVDVCGADVPPPSPLAVGEQLVEPTATALEHGEKLAHRRVDDRLDTLLAGLSGVVEDDEAAAEQRDVALLHRRQSVRLVVRRVLLSADAEDPAIEQAYRRCEDSLTCRLFLVEIVRRDGAQLGQCARELDHRVELLLVPPLPPARVIEVLPTTPRIRPDRLEVTVRERTDPDVGPGVRDREVADPLQRLAVADPVARFVDVPEATSPRDRRNPGHEHSERRSRVLGCSQSNLGRSRSDLRLEG